MIHWWESLDSMGAVRAKLSSRGKDAWDLEPMNLFSSNPVAPGGLWMPTVTGEEFRNFKALRATLREGRTAISGYWTSPRDKSKRKISFARAVTPSLLNATKCRDWGAFKAWAGMARDGGAALFRGHGDSEYRLSTSLHRMGRTRLERYCAEILPRFRTEAEAILDQRIDLNDANDFSMTLALAQHHGLPTPLLDWTRSAYVAAFFSFSEVIEKPRANRPNFVRVYALSSQFVSRKTPVVTVAFIPDYVSPLSVAPRRNPRLSAQQGEFLVTNIADLEDYLLKRHPGELTAADIPASCAVEALEDLAFMGLSAATMFPGLDGMCRNLKHRMLFKQGMPSQKL
jgi:hypothetical protein